VLVCGDAHHLDAGARARHADQVEPGLGELLARDVRVLLVPDALLVLHRQVEARLPALVAPDAPQAAAAAPAVAALAPRAVGRLLGRLLLREHRLILAEGARLALDRLGALVAEQRLPAIAEAPVRDAEEDVVDDAVR